MKARFYQIIVLCLFIANTSFAQSPVILKAFKQRFPDAKSIKWSKNDDKQWQANFVLGPRKTYAAYDNDGHWLKSWQELKWDDLGLEEVKEAIKKDFPDYKDRKIIIHNDLFVGTYYNVDGMYYDWIGNIWPPKQ